MTRKKIIEIIIMHIIALVIVVCIIGNFTEIPHLGSLFTYLYGMYIYRIIHVEK